MEPFCFACRPSPSMMKMMKRDSGSGLRLRGPQTRRICATLGWDHGDHPIPQHGITQIFLYSWLTCIDWSTLMVLGIPEFSGPLYVATTRKPESLISAEYL